MRLSRHAELVAKGRAECLQGCDLAPKGSHVVLSGLGCMTNGELQINNAGLNRHASLRLYGVSLCIIELSNYKIAIVIVIQAKDSASVRKI